MNLSHGMGDAMLTVRTGAAAVITAVAGTCALAATASAQAGRPTGNAAYDSAFYAWEAGAYPDALRRLDRLLAGPEAARYVRPAAELTGEVFVTTELAEDGRAVRWSPDGRHVAYEVGSGAARRTQIVALDGPAPRAVALVAGTGLVFDGAGHAAYIGGSPPTVVVRELASGRETRQPLPGLTPTSLAWGPGAAPALHVMVAAAGSSDLYRLGGGAPVQVTTQPGVKADPVWLTGERLLYRGGQGQPFSIQDLRTGQVRSYAGAAPAVSADGSTVAYVARDGGAYVLHVLRDLVGMNTPRGYSRDEPVELLRRTAPIAQPALSADGSLVAYTYVPREDREIYVMEVATRAERRITREIQHDDMPRFIDATKLFAVMGESRHRRSFMYDLATLERTRLHHNNTVRTVAPEYEWALSPDGTKLLIVADRDGNTISPERGVFLMDLTRPVSLDAVRARVRSQLAHEEDLRRRGAQLFAGIEAAVRSAVGDVSKDRAYRYSYDLYQFDSKHITQPGNAQAIEYLAAQLRQWGYEPELQWFEPRPRAAAGGVQPAPVRTANVIAKLPGTVHPEVIYIVSSHFDSVERAPGADDNTSGTAALLEAARVLAKRPQAATIHFAFFTGEESGLLGAREYVRRAVAAGDRVVGALNNDMIGFANDQRLDNTIRYASEGIRDVQHAAAFLFTDMITYDTKYYRGTDANVFYDAWGEMFAGIGSYPILGNPHYHQPHDQLETINHQLVAEVAKVTVASLMQLARVPSRPKIAAVSTHPGSREIEVAWEPVPESDVTSYIVRVIDAAGTEKSSRTVAAGAQLSARVAYAAGDVVEVWAVSPVGRSWDAARAQLELR
jgi:hypothetical protein